MYVCHKCHNVNNANKYYNVYNVYNSVKCYKCHKCHNVNNANKYFNKYNAYNSNVPKRQRSQKGDVCCRFSGGSLAIKLVPTQKYICNVDQLL